MLPLAPSFGRRDCFVRGCGGRGGDQGIHLLVADVEAAELVERQLIAGAQPPDLASEQRIEARQQLAQIGFAVHSRRSPSDRRKAARPAPVRLSTTSSGGRATKTRIASGSNSTRAPVCRKLRQR